MIRITFFLLCLLNIQKSDKRYFGKSHNYSTIYSYSVAEIYISKDSIMTRYDYKVPNKKEWKNYKTYSVQKEIQRISKRGNYYHMFNIENDIENEMHCLKIINKSLTYYFMDPKGVLVKGFTFKRKE